MRPPQKLDLALTIEALGVDVVEAGFPSSSPSEFQAVKMISESLTSAHVATLNRALPQDIHLAVEAGGTERHHLQVMATGSEIHLKHKRGIGQAEAQREVVAAIALARSLGVRHVTLAIEDASRGSDALLRPLITESVAAGADTLTIADTTGCMVPAQYGALIGRVRSWVAADVTISTHCHEDLGLALANALAGVDAGAQEVQATLAGIGERAGNTSLEELIAVLTYKAEELHSTTTARTEGLWAAFEALSEAIGLPAPRNKALFGVNAFATQAGIHQAGLLRSHLSYEYVEPSRFGRERTMLVGRHSGRAVLRHVLTEMRAPADDQLVEELYETYIANRGDGTCLRLSELRALIDEHRTAPAGGRP
ncbi:hypothetical protein GCM10023220_68120 [Streptomyces ziwulingensis]|uniref:Pyruvate carboxyltransferase domain-containing protein n=2 Tax=Streptomyces ziwulingensis TaxID=1045501 RepID=A0ABP9D6C5_9ACTN